MKPFHLVAKMQVKPGKAELLNATLGPLMQAVSKEEGTLDYRGFANGGDMMLMETYAGSAAFLKHMENPAVQKALGAFPELFDNVKVTILGTPNDKARAAMAMLAPVYYQGAGGVSRLFPETVTN